MKAFSVPEVKPFMAGLLQGSLFADWELRQAELGLACRITLQGAANMEYLTEHDTAFLHWPEIQPKIRQNVSTTNSILASSFAFSGFLAI